MFAKLSDLHGECRRYLDINENVIRGIRDRELLRESFIDVLTRNAIFNKQAAIRKECRILIRSLASFMGIHSKLAPRSVRRIVFHLPGFLLF